MQPVPRIFVSATSRDLRTARGLVSEGLRRMECMPIVQDDFAPDYKSVRDMLRTKIQTCNAVVHLAGFYYGAEPQPVIPGSDRRSFTQMEYEIAMELKLPCYVFLCGKDFPFDKHDPEPEEKQALQMAHRDRLLKRDELFYEFATPEELANRTRELQLSVEGLRGELAKERFRRRMTLAACIVLFLIGGGYFYKRMQKADGVIAETTAQLQKQGDLIAQLLAEQKRVREEGAGSAAEIAAKAQVNVAKANNQSVEEVQRGVQQALAKAKAAVAAAGNDKPKLIAALKKLINVERALGHQNEAYAALQQLHKALDREVYPEEWAKLTKELPSNTQMGLAGKYAEDTEMLKEAVQWAASNPKLGEEHPATLELMSSLAPRLPTNESIALLRAIVRTREKALGSEAEQKTTSEQYSLALALNSAASDEKNDAFAREADELLQRVIAAHTKKYGPQSENVRSMIMQQARFLSGAGKFAEAEKVLNQLISEIEKKGDAMNPQLIDPFYRLARVKEDQRDYAGAIPIQRRLIKIVEKKEGADSDKALMHNSFLCSMLGDSGQADLKEEAEKLQRKVLETRIRLFGASQPNTLSTFERLADLLEKKGDMKGANELRVRRLEEMEKVMGPDDTAFATELQRNGISIGLHNDDDSRRTAVKLLQKSQEIRERKLPKGSVEIVRDMATIARYYFELKEHGKAESVLRKEIELREKAHPKDAKALALAYYGLYRGMHALHQDTDALVHARKALDLEPSNRAYQKIVTDLTGGGKAQLAPIITPAANGQPPSLETYLNFRIGINERTKNGSLTTTMMNLPAEAGRTHTIKGSWNGDKLERAYESNAKDDANGTFTSYYFNQNSVLMSVYRVRNGMDAPVKDVKKATDAFNFFDRKLVSWKRTQDAAEKAEDPGSEGFAKKGQETYDAAQAAVSALLKAGPKQK